MNRITESNLNFLVKRINEVTGSPAEPYTKLKNGKFKANIGNYHLDWAYGGVKLVRMHSGGGGIKEVLHSGFTTKRDLYNQLHSFLIGLDGGK